MLRPGNTSATTTLNARNYFNPAPAPVAELRYNVYGFNAGGQVPLFKEHPTFFFYNMEWRSEVDGGLLNLPVPLASEYPTAAGAVIPTTYNGKPSIISDPETVPGSIQFANCPGGVAPAGVTPGQPLSQQHDSCLHDQQQRDGVTDCWRQVRRHFSRCPRTA